MSRPEDEHNGYPRESKELSDEMQQSLEQTGVPLLSVHHIEAKRGDPHSYIVQHGTGDCHRGKDQLWNKWKVSVSFKEFQGPDEAVSGHF